MAIVVDSQGKPLAEARGEIVYGASFFDWFAAEARRMNGEVVPPPAMDRIHLHMREPTGVAALITPVGVRACKPLSVCLSVRPSVRYGKTDESKST